MFLEALGVRKILLAQVTFFSGAPGWGERGLLLYVAPDHVVPQLRHLLERLRAHRAFERPLAKGFNQFTRLLNFL